jgi:hypothetical protein
MAATRSVTRAERAGGDGDGGLMPWMDVEASDGGSRPCRRLRLRARSREREREIQNTEGSQSQRQGGVVAINSGACKRLPAPCLGVAQCQYGTSSRCEAERATARKQSASSSDSLLSRSPFAVSPHSLHLLSRRRCRLPSLCIASHRIASHPARTAASRSRSAHTTPPAFVYLRAPVDPDNDNASVRPQTHAHTYTHHPRPASHDADSPVGHPEVQNRRTHLPGRPHLHRAMSDHLGHGQGRRDGRRYQVLLCHGTSPTRYTDPMLTCPHSASLVSQP